MFLILFEDQLPKVLLIYQYLQAVNDANEVIFEFNSLGIIKNFQITDNSNET